MPATSVAQRRFFGLVRSVQRGDTSTSKVDQKVRDAAAKMKPEDVRDFAVTKEDALPKKAAVLLYHLRMRKQAEANQVASSVKRVEKAIHQAGVSRRKQLQKDLQQLHQSHQKLRQQHHDLGQQVSMQEQQAEERRLQMELEADQVRHQQQMQHEQEKMQLQMQQSQRQSQQEAEQSKQMAQAELDAQNLAANPNGDMPLEQIPFGRAALPQQEDDKKKPRR